MMMMDDDDDDDECVAICEVLGRRKRNYLEKTCPSATLYYIMLYCSSDNTFIKQTKAATVLIDFELIMCQHFASM
jgi:hypothetical protein